MDSGGFSPATNPSTILPSTVLECLPLLWRWILGVFFGLVFSVPPAQPQYGTCLDTSIPDTKYRIMTPQEPSPSDVRLLPEHVVERPKRAIVVVARPTQAIVLPGPAPSISCARLRRALVRTGVDELAVYK